MKLDISSEFEPGRARLMRESGGRVSKESLVTGVTHNVIFRKYIHIFGIGENGIQKGVHKLHIINYGDKASKEINVGLSTLSSAFGEKSGI
jgi:hypothetical protein